MQHLLLSITTPSLPTIYNLFLPPTNSPRATMSSVLTYSEVIHRLKKARDSSMKRYSHPSDQERLGLIHMAIEAGMRAASAGLKGAEMVPAEEIKGQVTDRIKEINSKYDAPQRMSQTPQKISRGAAERDDEDDKEEEEVFHKRSKQVEEILRSLRAAKRETLQTLGRNHGKVYIRLQRNYDATIQAVQNGKTTLPLQELQQILDEQLVEYLERYGSESQSSGEPAVPSSEQARQRHPLKSSVAAQNVPTPSYKPPMKRAKSPQSSSPIVEVRRKRAKQAEQPSPPKSPSPVDVLPLPSLEGLTRNEAFFKGYDYIIKSILNETAQASHPQFNAHFIAVRSQALDHYGLATNEAGDAIENGNTRMESATQTENFIGLETAIVAPVTPEPGSAKANGSHPGDRVSINHQSDEPLYGPIPQTSEYAGSPAGRANSISGVAVDVDEA
ncbi:hypothetical protein P154DRAFT_130351 [Amniculicola lignicola CBS 123094]|uniref:Uncharacterized protein n=1 Tax=Amniculicola lignicola CBS 123094 TaxID=1392246 RepID=A0A6A5VVY5_9PLEO|nr:hypothetical protein P154DRAFT_130351 [Amniculicola lignicola CBS 123094]